MDNCTSLLSEEHIRNIIIDNIAFSTIKKSNVHGYGLFATKDLDANITLGRLDGQKIDWKEFNNIKSSFDILLNDYSKYFFMEWNALGKQTLLTRSLRTKYSVINHSRNPNIKIIDSSMSIVTTKKIARLEEILIDYRNETLSDDYIQNYGKHFL